MRLSSPPRPSTLDPDRDLEQRVAELEALIEEARRRARRRRQRAAAVILLAGAIGAALLIGVGGHGGSATGKTGAADTANPPRLPPKGEPLGALPPSVGFVESFAFDPHNANVVYLLTHGGVVKTIDGGGHWKVIPATAWAGGYQTLAADPRHPGTLYAGTGLGVFKTVDSGRTWRRSSRGMVVRHFPDRNIGWVTALAVDPANANVVYAGSDRITKSPDGGRSWKTVFQPGRTRTPDSISVSALAIARTSPESIYALHADARTGTTSIYRSRDAGATWHMSTSVPGILHGFVTDLAIDPRDPATAYAAIGGTVLKTTDAGNSWLKIGHGLPVAGGLARPGCHCHGGVTTLAVDPHRPRTLYAGTSQWGIYTTTNGGHSWRRVAARGLYYMTVVGIDPARPTTVYGAGALEYDNSVHLFRSTDAGRTWVTAP